MVDGTSNFDMRINCCFNMIRLIHCNFNINNPHYLQIQIGDKIFHTEGSCKFPQHKFGNKNFKYSKEIKEN